MKYNILIPYIIKMQHFFYKLHDTIIQKKRFDKNNLMKKINKMHVNCQINITYHYH